MHELWPVFLNVGPNYEVLKVAKFLVIWSVTVHEGLLVSVPVFDCSSLNFLLMSEFILSIIRRKDPMNFHIFHFLVVYFLLPWPSNYSFFPTRLGRFTFCLIPRLTKNAYRIRENRKELQSTRGDDSIGSPRTLASA